MKIFHSVSTLLFHCRLINWFEILHQQQEYDFKSYLWNPDYLSVDDFMAAQSARLSESFAAHFADERSGARVNRHVPR